MGFTIKVDATNLDCVVEAFKIANNAIYFNDNSDYLTALYGVCKALCPDIEDEAIGSLYID